VGSTALLHPFPGTHPDQVSFEPATIANTLSNNRPTGSVGSWIEPLSLSWMFRLVNSSKCREHQAATARAVQLGHHQGVASPTGGQLQPQTGSVAAGALEAVIDVDAIITDTNRAALLLRVRIPPAIHSSTRDDQAGWRRQEPHVVPANRSLSGTLRQRQ
jgi:hypothetical protein